MPDDHDHERRHARARDRRDRPLPSPPALGQHPRPGRRRRHGPRPSSGTASRSPTDSTIETGEGQLSLTAPDRVGLNMVFDIGRRSSFDLEVEVPRGAAVSIEIGERRAPGRRPRPTSSRIRTASGDSTLDRIAGTLELDAVSGDARIEAAGALDLRARDDLGDLSVRAPRLGRAEIGHDVGRRPARRRAGRRRSVRHRDRSAATSTIVGRMGLRIEARTVTGDLRSELPHRREAGPGRKQLVVGDGADPVHVPLGLRRPPGHHAAGQPPGRCRDRREPRGRARGAGPAGRARGAGAARRSANPGAGGREVARMDVLRALERGELSVEAAMRRIAEIEEA